MEFQRIQAKLANYPVSKWFVAELRKLAVDLRAAKLAESAVLGGGVVTSGTISTSALGVSATAVTLKLNGVLKAALAALSDVDLFTTAGNVAQAVFEDGSSAAAILLTSGQVARVSVVAVDSNGAGGATGDNGAPLYLAVVAGTASTYASQTAFLTSAEIREALLASTGVHDGTTGFARLADVVWDQNGGSPTATVTVRRDA